MTQLQISSLIGKTVKDLEINTLLCRSVAVTVSLYKNNRSFVITGVTARVINKLWFWRGKGKKVKESSLSSSLAALIPQDQLIVVAVKCIMTRGTRNRKQKDNTRLYTEYSVCIFNMNMLNIRRCWKKSWNNDLKSTSIHFCVQHCKANSYLKLRPGHGNSFLLKYKIIIKLSPIKFLAFINWRKPGSFPKVSSRSSHVNEKFAISKPGSQNEAFGWNCF